MEAIEKRAIKVRVCQRQKHDDVCNNTTDEQQKKYVSLGMWRLLVSPTEIWKSHDIRKGVHQNTCYGMACSQKEQPGEAAKDSRVGELEARVLQRLPHPKPPAPHHPEHVVHVRPAKEERCNEHC